jgi:hypothetical protein
MTRRRFKEPTVPAGSPFEPVIEAGRAMVRALSRALPADEDSRNLVLSKVEGMESILLLCQRAAAGEKLDVPQIVKVERAPIDDRVILPGDKLESLAQRVRRLEDHVFGNPSPNPEGLERGVEIQRSIERATSRRVPSILKTPKSTEPKVGGLGRCERALLAVLAKRAGQETTAAQLSVLSGYSIKSSGFQNSLSRLRSLGYAEGGAHDVRITGDGEREAEDQGLGRAPMPTGRALVEYWVGSLPRAEGVVLQAICDAHPRALDQDELSEATKYSRTSSGFQNAVSKLRSLKLATKGWPLRASAVFFEGGSR